MLVRRVAALLFALWFALLTGESTWLSGCTAHASDPSGRTPGEQTDHQGGHAQHRSPLPADGENAHQCACPGPICGTGSVLPSTSAAVVPSSVIEDGVAVVASAQRPLVYRGDHVIPFANGPPLALSGA
jgi:hypothetical protein